MDKNSVYELAKRLVNDELDADQFLGTLQSAMAAELTDTTLDLDRDRRCGYPEVVYGESKSVQSLTDIFKCQIASHQPILATRVSQEKAAGLAKTFPDGRYNELGRTFRIDSHIKSGKDPADDMPREFRGVAIVTAGTSDLAVAEEARETVDWMGYPCELIQDVGVAGPHRLPKHVETLRKSAVVVVVAGMEGALPSVVGGYVACPVIAVPTSVGYGAAFGGVAALLGMLNSCAANVTVVNIDAGFKAGYLAGLIAGRCR